MWGAMFGGMGGDDDDGGNFIGVLAMAILAPIAAMLLQMSLSRSREYQADASGAHLVNDGEALARALEKIEAYEAHDYHQPSDQLRATWTFDGMIDDARLGFLAGYELATTAELPSWKPGDEFEAARKAAPR